MQICTQWNMRKNVILMLLLCMCLFPLSSIAAEALPTDTSAKYVTIKHDATYIANPRAQGQLHVLAPSVGLSLLASKSIGLVYAQALLIVFFLFIIQIRLKWLLLMPLKYRSKFVSSLLLKS